MDAATAAAGRGEARIEPGIRKPREILEEFRSVVLGQGSILDAVLPAVTLLVVRYRAGDRPALAAALAIGASLTLLGVIRRQPALTAVLGRLGSLLAFVVARTHQRSELFFLLDAITNAALAAACLVSVGLRRPMVAWTSHLIHRWPREWCWHPRVLPAFREATLAWTAFFLLQAGLEERRLRLHWKGVDQWASGTSTCWPGFSSSA
jgi:hypothetical protein